MNAKHERRRRRRQRIHEAWRQHYEDLITAKASLAEILGYDDQRLMKLVDRGLSRYNIGKLLAARRIFRGLVLLDPWVPYFHFLLATAHEKLGDLAAAHAEFGTAVDLAARAEPTPELLGFALLGCARVAARAGRRDEALDLLDRIRQDGERLDPIVVNTALLIAEHLRATATA